MPEDQTEISGAPTKRIILPEDKEIRTRLDNLQEARKEILFSCPEVVGMTVFGSMVGGTAKGESDIDGYIYLDESKVKNQLTPKDWRVAKQKQQEDADYFKKMGFSKPSTSLSEFAVRNHFIPIIDKTLQAHGLSEKQISGLRIATISSDIINEELRQAIEKEKEYLDYLQEYRKRVDATLTGKRVNSGSDLKFPESHTLPNKIHGLFHIEIGDGLKTYRMQVVETLKAEGEVGETIWRDIYNNLQVFEHRGRYDEFSELYPQTLSDAEKYFHLSE